jgi:hypothetical protein
MKKLVLILMVLLLVTPVLAVCEDLLAYEDTMGYCISPTTTITIAPTITEIITTMITAIITPTPTPTPTPSPEPTISQPTPEPTIPPFLKEDEKVTEEQFILKPESESEIIVKDPPATVLVSPILSSGEKLEETDIKEFPLDRPVTSLVESTRSGIITTKIVQIYPESVLEVSNDANTIKQSAAGDVKLELYYGYQTDNKPWQYYYKVESCVDGTCRVVRAEFATKRVWIESVSESVITSIIGIPAYEALP